MPDNVTLYLPFYSRARALIYKRVLKVRSMTPHNPLAQTQQACDKETVVQELQNVTIEPPTKRGPGQPTKYNEFRAGAIVEAIRNGLAPTRAASKTGVHHSCLAEWRDKYPEFSEAIARAEAEYLQDRIADLESCRTKWETPDPKALELLLRRFPEFRVTQEVEQRSVNLNVSVQLSPEDLAQLQERHRLAKEAK